MAKDELVLVLAEDPSASQLQLVGVEEDREVLDDAVLLKHGPEVDEVDARDAGLSHDLVGDALWVVGRVAVRDLNS